MDILTHQQLFINILRAGLHEMALDDASKAFLTPDALEAVVSLGRAHDVIPVISSALLKSGLLSNAGFLSMIRRDEMIAAYRHEQIQYAYAEICTVFEDNKIYYVPLKGAVIRPHYPKESMRTSCDIDILIREEDVDRAVEALREKGFQRGKRDYHDISLYQNNSVHLELHYSLQENIDALDRVLKNAWSFVVPTPQGVQFALTDEFLVFYHFAHMYYHFVAGGCGIRSLMDVHVMKYRMGHSESTAQALLSEAGIVPFAAGISRLADVCFGDAPPDDMSDALISYILSGGTYGSRDNKLSAAKLKGGNTLTYAIRRLFFPYKAMARIYPILKKLPFLLPFCYAARLGKLLSCGKARDSVAELIGFQTLTDADTETVAYLWNKLGIK